METDYEMDIPQDFQNIFTNREEMTSRAMEYVRSNGSPTKVPTLDPQIMQVNHDIYRVYPKDADWEISVAGLPYEQTNKLVISNTLRTLVQEFVTKTYNKECTGMDDLEKAAGLGEMIIDEAGTIAKAAKVCIEEVRRAKIELGNLPKVNMTQ